MNTWHRVECCKYIQIGIQNAVEKLLSIFDIFMSQFSFTTTVSELKELNYSYHYIYTSDAVLIHCWLLLSTANTPTFQRPGSPCWWRLGRRKHWVPQPCLCLLSLKFLPYAIRVPHFPCSPIHYQHHSKKFFLLPLLIESFETIVGGLLIYRHEPIMS